MPCSKFSIVLCEGYYDRAFWAGLLEHKEWKSAVKDPKDKKKDPYGRPIIGGQFGYYKGDYFVVIVPCKGKDAIAQTFNDFAKRTHKDLESPQICNEFQIVINVDEDRTEQEDNVTWNDDKVLSQQSKVVAELPTKQWSHLCELKVIRWATEHSGSVGIPQKQTLERLVCTAICSAYPAPKWWKTISMRKTRKVMRGHICPSGTAKMAVMTSIKDCGETIRFARS
jgi:hypothetical protein